MSDTCPSHANTTSARRRVATHRGTPWIGRTDRKARLPALQGKTLRRRNRGRASFGQSV